MADVKKQDFRSSLTRSQYERYVAGVINTKAHSGEAFYQKDMKDITLPVCVDVRDGKINQFTVFGANAASLFQTAVDANIPLSENRWLDDNKRYEMYQYNINERKLNGSEALIGIVKGAKKGNYQDFYVAKDKDGNSSMVERVNPQTRETYVVRDYRTFNHVAFNVSQLTNLPPIPEREIVGKKIAVPLISYDKELGKVRKTGYTSVEFSKEDAKAAVKMLDNRIAICNDSVKAMKYAITKVFVCAAAEIDYKAPKLPELEKDYLIKFNDISFSADQAGTLINRAVEMNSEKNLERAGNIKAYEERVAKLANPEKLKGIVKDYALAYKEYSSLTEVRPIAASKVESLCATKLYDLGYDRKDIIDVINENSINAFNQRLLNNFDCTLGEFASMGIDYDHKDKFYSLGAEVATKGDVVAEKVETAEKKVEEKKEIAKDKEKAKTKSKSKSLTKSKSKGKGLGD